MWAKSFFSLTWFLLTLLSSWLILGCLLFFFFPKSTLSSCRSWLNLGASFFVLWFYFWLLLWLNLWIHQFICWAYWGEMSPTVALDMLEPFRFLHQLELLFVRGSLRNMTRLMASIAHEMSKLHLFLFLHVFSCPIYCLWYCYCWNLSHSYHHRFFDSSSHRWLIWCCSTSQSCCSNSSVNFWAQCFPSKC